jgi:hypothetical protein
MSNINAIKRETLKGVLAETIRGNIGFIQDSNQDLIEIEPIIESFTPSCEGFDTKILSIASQIQNIQSDIVNLYEIAYNAGCGGAVGDYFQDTVENLSYKISDENYVDPDHSDFDAPVNNPYDVVSVALTSGNVGYGTFTKFTQNNTSAGIGSTYTSIGSGGPLCPGYATQIAAKEALLEPLRAEIISLIVPVNAIKEERVPYHYRRFRDKVDIIELNAKNAKINIAVEVLNNPVYDPYTT